MHCIQRISLNTVLLLLVVLVSGVSAQTLKIAVAATDSGKDSHISTETGRAPFFLFFDNEGNFLEAISNPARNQEGGISRTVVALLTDKEVTMVIATSIGDKMRQAFTNHKIDLVIKTGTADDAVMRVIQKR